MGPGASKTNENGAQEHPKSIKIVPRSVQNRKKWCPGTLQEGPCEEIGKESPATLTFLSFFQRLGRFWAQFWTPLGAKGVPKSAILAPSRDKSWQNEVQEEVLKKTWNFDWILIGKWEAWRPQIVDFTVVLQCYLRIHSFSKKLKVHENLCENGPQK